MQLKDIKIRVSPRVLLILVDCTCTGGQFAKVVPELGFRSMSVRQKKALNHTFFKLDLLVVFDGVC